MKVFDQIVSSAMRTVKVGGDEERAARNINAEFHATAYVSKGKLWVSYSDENGKRDTRVVM
jgi:hypothetical protein